jgi:hypothetical protein
MKTRSIGYTYGSTSGVYSFRNEKSIRHESLLEKEFIQLMDFNDNVIDIIGQPIIEYISKEGKKRKYTADFLVFFKEPKSQKHIIKPLLVEVKPNKRLIHDWKELKGKFIQGIKFAKQHGYRFKIFNENRIQSNKLKNIVFLHRYKDYKPNPDDVNIIINHLQAVGHTTLEHLTTHLYVTDLQKGNGISHIWHLVYSKIIVCDLSTKLTNNTVLWLNIEEENLGVFI